MPCLLHIECQITFFLYEEKERQNLFPNICQKRTYFEKKKKYSQLPFFVNGQNKNLSCQL